MLLRGSDFVDDGLRRCTRIWRGEDRTSYDQEIGACLDRLGGSRGTDLIVTLCLLLILGTNSRRDDQEIAAASLADRSRFLNGGNHSIDASAFRELGEFQHTRIRR